VGTEARHAFVLDRGQHGATKHDLPTRITAPLSATRECGQTVSCGSQPREAFIKNL
jgi:hypothetical protein